MACLNVDELFPGYTVAVYPPDHVDAVELTMAMTGQDRNQSGQILRRLKEETFETNKLNVLKLSGKGNLLTKTVHFDDAIKLIMVLPGKIAKQTRQKFADIITRYFAGDASLIPEIEANAASDHPINVMAREAVKEKEAEETDPFIVGHKRKLLELDVAERSADLERKTLENDRMRRDAIMQEKERTMAFALQGIKASTDLSTLGVLDERTRLLFKDLITNMVLSLASQGPSQRLIASGEGEGGAQGAPSSSPQPLGISNFLTISNVAAGMGHAKLTPAQLQRIGLLTSKAFVARYGSKPSKHDQFVDGAVRQVCTYEDKDRDLIEAAVCEVLQA